MAPSVAEELVQKLAPDEATLAAARALVEEGRFDNLSVSADGTWLLGECRGSAREPYHVSADFADPANPTLRCTCASRKQPCKHGLGLLLAHVAAPDRFGQREPSEDLQIKREKKAALDEKKRTGAAVPRKVSKAAQDKKAAAQREGLDALEKLLVELVAGGQWFEAARLEKIDRVARQLSDASLPAAVHLLRQLVLIGKAKDTPDEQRVTHSTEVLGQLWAALQKARQLLEGKASGDSAETDALAEELLGKTWQMNELRERGYMRPNVKLFELAFERNDDEARQQRVEVSDLLDLSTGEVHQAVAYRPFKGLSPIPEQTSHQAPVSVSEAAVYPGFVNRRIRWERGGEQPENGSGRPLEKAYGLAKPDLKSAVDAFRDQLQRPLAPREAVVFVRARSIGKAGRMVVIEDSTGTRIEAADKRSDYSNVGNLVRVAGMLGKDKPALLLRLFVRPQSNTIVALPLAALTPRHHLRLGL